MAITNTICNGMEGEILKACSNTVSSILLGIVLGIIIAVAIILIKFLKR